MKKYNRRSHKYVLGLIASAMLLATGCGKEPDKADPVPTVDIDYAQTKPAFVVPQWFSAIEEFYEASAEEDGEFLSVFSPDIPGEFQYCIQDDKTSVYLFLQYEAPSGDEIGVILYPENEFVYIDGVSFYGEEMVSYDVTGLYNELGEKVESLVHGDVSEDDDRLSLRITGDEQKIKDNMEDVGTDILVLYSRILNMANYAFADIDVNVEDFGVFWGEEYRKMSPESPLSGEIVVENEHHFVDGRCEDCGIIWTKYMYDLIKESGYYNANNKTYIYDGQDSEIMGMKSSGVNYQVANENEMLMMSHISGLDEKYTRSCIMSVWMNEGESDKYSFTFEYVQHSDEEGDDPDKDYIVYDIFLDADADNIAEIFASKETFKKACIFRVEKYNSEDYIHQQIGSEISEELFEQLWEEKDIFIAFMDNGMRWLDTSFDDAGIEFDK